MDGGRAEREALLLAAGAMILAVVVIAMAWFYRPGSPGPPATNGQNQAVPVQRGPFRIEPATLTIRAGTSSDMQIILDTGTEPIEAFDLVASYDPQKIKIDNILTDGSPFGFYPRSTAEGGTILISGNSYGQNPSSFTVSGMVAILRITARENLDQTAAVTIIETDSKAFSGGKKI